MMARKLAVQLGDEKLLQKIDWFINITEKNIKSTLKFIKRLDIHLWNLQQQLQKLLKKKQNYKKKQHKTRSIKKMRV